MADDVLLLHDGEVLMNGPLEEVLAQGEAEHLEELFMRKIGLIRAQNKNTKFVSHRMNVLGGKRKM